MEAKELRIGNTVLDEIEDTPVTIRGISEVEPDVYDFEIKYETGMYHEVQCEYIQPIPLDEQWLKRFGFELVNTGKANYYFYKDDTLRFTLDKKSLLHCSIGNNGHGVMYQIIKYIHQLQNLYFALTGEELTIKEQ